MSSHGDSCCAARGEKTGQQHENEATARSSQSDEKPGAAGTSSTQQSNPTLAGSGPDKAACRKRGCCSQ